MRRAWVLLALASASLGCKATSDDGAGVDVYVPAAIDGGEDAPYVTIEAGYLGRVDRAGHPLVTLLLVPGALQDTYNAQPSFSTSVSRTTAGALETRLVQLDTLVLDGGDAGDEVDWPVPDGGTQPLLPIFLTDVLFVDTGRSCVGKDGGFIPSYLDLDREAFLGAEPHRTCGGRSPNEPVVDETLALLVTGNRKGAPVVSQGVTGPTKLSSTTFPYLAPPN